MLQHICIFGKATGTRVRLTATVWAFVFVFSLLAPFASAHEGHKPLPAKGVEVDLKRGSVLLTDAARKALAVETADVTMESGEDRVLAYARLVSPWQNRAFAASAISGRITKLYIHPGENVRQGQTLADVESPELQKLQLDLINAQNSVRLSDQLVKHFQVIGGDAVPGSKLQDAETNHRENLNAVESSRLKLLSLGLPESQIQRLETDGESQLIPVLQIRSPIAGTAYHSDLSIGTVVTTTEHLFEVVDLSSVWGKIEILESDLQKVHVGQAVEITLPTYEGEKFRGQIKVKEIYLDPETHLGTAWIDLENPPDKPARLLPGLFGQAQIIIEAPAKLLTIPATALARDGAERFVLVQEESTEKASQYIKRNVVVVRQSSGIVQFRAEQVFPGDRVVTVGTHELFNFFVQGVLRLSKEASENIQLRIETVGLQKIGDGFAIDGLVELPAAGRDKVSSQLAGTIEKVLIQRGQQVHAGDVICELFSLEFQDLQRQLITAQNDLVNLETTLQRWEPSRGSSAIPQRQRWELESQLKSKQNERDSLKGRLETLGLTAQQISSLVNDKALLNSLPLRATIDGYVVGFDKVIGEIVGAGQIVVEIHDPANALIRGFVAERELTQVQVGQSARVRFVAAPEFVGRAKVIRNDQGLDIVNRTLSVWLEFNDPPPFLLQHDMLARINLISEQTLPVLAVSHESVVSEPSGKYVFVRSEDGKFERRLIETGRADDRFVEVVAGLKENETIATWGVSELESAHASLR